MVGKVLRRVVLTITAAALLLAGVLTVGHCLRGSLRDRHSLTVSDIDCDPPPGQSRATFLAEVHYYGRLPEQLNTLDPTLIEQLRTAFAAHPRVHAIKSVVIAGPKRVRVEVDYASP